MINEISFDIINLLMSEFSESKRHAHTRKKFNVTSN